MKNVPLVLALCVLAALPAAAQPAAAEEGRIVVDEQGFTVRSRVDWAAGTLDVEASRLLDPSTPALPRAKADAETYIESRLSGFMVAALSPVPVDSGHSFGDLLGNDAALFSRESNLVSSAQPRELFLSDDFTRLIARYALPLFGDQGLASPLYPSQGAPVRSRLGWVPSRPFTGLLIYAKGKLPAVGTEGMAEARPAIFPRIFDEQMGLVMEKEMCDPEALARWGMVGYAATLDDPVTLLRAGELPLRLVARGVFGGSASDLIIPTEGAMQLLTVPENRKLLQAGRIVVVYDSLDEGAMSSPGP